jgi:hypothetical protein
MSMFISLCPRTFGLGHVLIQASPESNLRSQERRMTRTATLDGGVAIEDGGWSAGDRTLTIALPTHQATPATIAALEALRANHLRISVATDEGVFEALIQRTNWGRRNTLSLAVSEQLSE